MTFLSKSDSFEDQLKVPLRILWCVKKKKIVFRKRSQLVKKNKENWEKASYLAPHAAKVIW